MVSVETPISLKKTEFTVSTFITREVSLSSKDKLSEKIDQFPTWIGSDG